MYPENDYRKVLFVAYLFPPVGGSGVQRRLKYVKYLPEFGWMPDVLTVKPITYYVYDETLLDEIPKGVNIIRSESLDPLRISKIINRLGRNRKKASGKSITYRSDKSNTKGVLFKIKNWFAFPDTQLGWVPFAFLKGFSEIKRNKPEAIVAPTHPSSGIVAYLLSKATGVPYLLDFADGWTDNPYLSTPSHLHRRGHKILERIVVGNADAVTVYSTNLAQKFSLRYPQLKNKIDVLPNGFDEDDFKDIVPIERPQIKKRIVYMGSLYVHQETNFKTFLSALKSLPDSLLSDLEVLFIGNHYPEADNLVNRYGLEHQIQFMGYLPHTVALSYLLSADATLLFIKPDDYTMVTGKIFEYLYAGKPILACVEPRSEGANILVEAGFGKWITDPFDAEGLKQNILELIIQGWQPPSRSKLSKFNRKNTTRQLSIMLDKVAIKS